MKALEGSQDVSIDGAIESILTQPNDTELVDTIAPRSNSDSFAGTMFKDRSSVIGSIEGNAIRTGMNPKLRLIDPLGALKKNEISIEEALDFKISDEELIARGLPTNAEIDKLIETNLNNLDRLTVQAFEQIPDFETGWAVFTNYLTQVHSSLSQRLEHKKNPTPTVVSGIVERNVGAEKFLNTARVLMSEEDYLKLEERVLVSLELLTLTEADLFDLSVSKAIKTEVIGRMVGFAYSDAIVFEDILTSIDQSQVRYSNYSYKLHSYIEGIRSEAVIARILAELSPEELGFQDIEVRKTTTFDEAAGIDLIVAGTDPLDSSVKVDRVYLDIKKEFGPGLFGVCRIIPYNNRKIPPAVLEGDNSEQNISDKYAPAVLDTVRFRKVPGVSVRVPSSFATSALTTDLLKTDSELYNSLLIRLRTEIKAAFRKEK
jgi:hypothetical protein